MMGSRVDKYLVQQGNERENKFKKKIKLKIDHIF